MRLQDIAAALNARFEGDGTLEISRAVHPTEAEGPEDLALAMDGGLVALLGDGKARAAVIAEGAELPPDIERRIEGRIVVGRPRLALYGLLNLYDRPVLVEPGIHPTAWVSPDARLGEGVSVGAFASVGPGAEIGAGTYILAHASIGRDARIGPDCRILAGVRIGERVVLGARCIIQPGAVIGADGFSFVTPEPGSVETAKATGVVSATNTTILRINSIGTVILGDDVEVGANTAIDRGTVTATKIGSGTKIDNLVQIGHNVQIGTNCILCGQVGIAGSCEIGDRVVLGGKVGIADHVKIGNDVVAAALSGIGGDIPARSVYMGLPAMPRAEYFSQLKNLRRLKRLVADVGELKRRVMGS